MNKYGRNGVKCPDLKEFADICRVRRDKELSETYGVSVRVIQKWKSSLNLTNRSDLSRVVTWVVSESGCFICTSHKAGSTGYPEGSKVASRRNICRVVYEEKFGKINEGLVLRHKCDVRMCVNVNHLEVGTQTENLRDAYVRKRNAYGGKHGNAKLTVEDVVKIRSLKGKISLKKLGDMFGVDGSTIYAAMHGETWVRAMEDLKNEVD